MLVGNDRKEFFDFFGESLFGALAGFHEVGVKVEGLLFVRVEETENFDEDLAHFWVELDVVLGLLAYAVGEELEGLVDFVVAVFFGKMFFHAVEDVEELEQSVEAADELDFEEPLFVEFLIGFAVEVFSSFVDHVNELFQIQGDLQVLLLNFDPHLRQLDLLLDLARVQKTK